ncbi:hypothetical protein [Catalinimonas niigatensis]|uniref:hypothetical protein n=1 Tax=Catalinimonas niigatensis TaxID=1397264 RepID=UPI0026667AE9|nr:hypothetical protein [Catalinimonas niigatensis]WPP53455.1 hypothetical protein PZB72_13850 [Catalinimonas niigatensis]
MEALLTIIRQGLYYCSFALVPIGIGILIFYFIRLSSTSDAKAKYDFINKYEKKALWYSCLVILTAAGTYVTSILATEWLYVFVGVFVSLMFGLILGVVIYNYLEYYYPTFIEKRLQKLRYKPRVSSTGNQMKLLSEAEEDVHLDEGMQAEESIFSVDYDVWIDEQSGETKIEKYKGHLHAEKSPTCGYYTLRVVKEEIIESPTEEKEGTLMKYYECSYTGYKTKKIFNIAKLKRTTKEAGKTFAPTA